ncbi:hypothetical protein [Nocardia fluminea]|uniref:hypothetical protein n=1 Tax=Nocardia fluminea TaxID=134984 RepID=UPI0033CBD0E9
MDKNLEISLRKTVFEVLEDRLGEAMAVGSPICGALLDQVSYGWDFLMVHCQNQHRIGRIPEVE